MQRGRQPVSNIGANIGAPEKLKPDTGKPHYYYMSARFPDTARTQCARLFCVPPGERIIIAGAIVHQPLRQYVSLRDADPADPIQKTI
jgi:hypothetical protein